MSRKSDIKLAWKACEREGGHDGELVMQLCYDLGRAAQAEKDARLVRGLDDALALRELAKRLRAKVRRAGETR